jgi:Flp pilus assembly protein TadG
MRRFFTGDEEGQALVLGALMFLTMLFFVGLAIDAGQLYVAKRTEQEAADAAAFAGAVVLYQGGVQPPLAATVAAAKLAAKQVATQNGYTDDLGVGNMVVVINSPPTSGVYNNDVNHVEVTITHKVKTSLVPAQAAFNPVRARGVAGAESFNNGYALMALDQSCTDGGLALSPNENIHLVGGGALINSCGANAVTGAEVGQDFTISPAGFSVDVVGRVGGAFPPGITVNTGIAPLPDPLAGVYAKPSVSGLPVDPPFVGGVAYSGVYTTTLDSVDLCGGIYILKGGGMNGDIGLKLTGTDPNTGLPCNGQSLIFNTMSNYPFSGGTCDSIGRNGNHPVVLRPMTTGQYKNLGIYQDPACTAPMQFGGNQSALDAGGTIYLPNATLSMNGNPATIVAGQFIAKRLDIQNSNLNITYSVNTTAQPVVPRLAE